MGKNTNKPKKRGKAMRNERQEQEICAKCSASYETIAINEERYAEEVAQIRRAREMMPDYRHNYLGPTMEGAFDNPVMPDYRNANEVLGDCIQKLKDCIGGAVITMEKAGNNYVDVDDVAVDTLG